MYQDRITHRQKLEHLSWKLTGQVLTATSSYSARRWAACRASLSEKACQRSTGCCSQNRPLPLQTCNSHNGAYYRNYPIQAAGTAQLGVPLFPRSKKTILTIEHPPHLHKPQCGRFRSITLSTLPHGNVKQKSQ